MNRWPDSSRPTIAILLGKGCGMSVRWMRKDRPCSHSNTVRPRKVPWAWAISTVHSPTKGSSCCILIAPRPQSGLSVQVGESPAALDLRLGWLLERERSVVDPARTLVGGDD